mmetsp:Transcript_71375/g.113121  ORF Transcript_71375/g.113121 Transcript_71375/m.113121 type:complete len:221 (-) Transcript_71375:2-664(-)
MYCSGSISSPSSASVTSVSGVFTVVRRPPCLYVDFAGGTTTSVFGFPPSGPLPSLQSFPFAALLPIPFVPTGTPAGRRFAAGVAGVAGGAGATEACGSFKVSPGDMALGGPMGLGISSKPSPPSACDLGAGATAPSEVSLASLSLVLPVPLPEFVSTSTSAVSGEVDFRSSFNSITLPAPESAPACGASSSRSTASGGASGASVMAPRWMPFGSIPISAT